VKCTFVHALEAWAVTASTRCVKASMQVWILYRTSLKATMAFLARVSNHQGGLLSLLLFSSLHPSSLFPGHHSKIPSCMKRFARNAFQCSSIIIHNGHLPLEPPIGGTFPISSSHNPHQPGNPDGKSHASPGLADPETVERCRDSYNRELDRQLQDATRSHGTLADGLTNWWWLIGWCSGKKSHPVWFSG
jgi:hypothetical protein